MICSHQPWSLSSRTPRSSAPPSIPKSHTIRATLKQLPYRGARHRWPRIDTVYLASIAKCIFAPAREYGPIPPRGSSMNSSRDVGWQQPTEASAQYRGCKKAEGRMNSRHGIGGSSLWLIRGEVARRFGSPCTVLSEVSRGPSVRDVPCSVVAGRGLSCTVRGESMAEYQRWYWDRNGLRACCSPSLCDFPRHTCNATTPRLISHIATNPQAAKSPSAARTVGDTTTTPHATQDSHNRRMTMRIIEYSSCRR